MPETESAVTPDEGRPQGEQEARAAFVRDIFLHALTRWIAEGPKNGVLREVLQNNETGELMACFQGELKSGRGAVLYQYSPQAAIDLLLTRITDDIDSLPISVQLKDGVQTVRWVDGNVTPEERDAAIVLTTVYATCAFLQRLEANAADAINRSYYEATGLAIAALQGKIAEGLQKKPGVRDVKLSAHSAIKAQVDKAAAEEETRWAALYSCVPGTLLRPTKGRPPLWWTKAALVREVKKALRELPPDGRNLEGVYGLMKQRHAGRMPRSAQAFKQLLYEKGLRLKALKELAAKGRKRRIT